MRLRLLKRRIILRRRLRQPSPDCSAAVFTTPWTRHQARWAPFSVSLSLHALLVSALVIADNSRPRLEFEPLSAEQIIADDRYEVTWYTPRNELPPVQPADETPAPVQQGSGDRQRPRFRLPQRVAASDPNAASSRQMIWDEAPEVEIARDVRSPNLLEWTAPEVRRPRFEWSDPTQPAPGRQAIAAESAPQLNAAAQPAPLTPQTSRLRYLAPERETVAPAPRAAAVLAAPEIASGRASFNPALAPAAPRLRYVVPEAAPVAPNSRSIAAPEAPAIETTAGTGADVSQYQRLARLRYQMPQTEAQEAKRTALSGGPAPQISAPAAPVADTTQFQPLSRLRYQDDQLGQSAATPASPKTLGEGAAAPPSAATLGTASASSGDGALVAELARAQTAAALVAPGRRRAVVGVDPALAVAESLPRGSRGAEFTAGPDGAAGTGVGGSDASGQRGGDAMASVRIPHLSVLPAAPTPDPARGASTGAPATQTVDPADLRRQFLQTDLRPIPAIGVAKIETPIDPWRPFPGRAVYTLAINMPNVSSYSGSWIMEFAEAAGRDSQPGLLNPPRPRRKVDPVYSRAAAAERVEGDVVLHALIRTDGLVDHIRVLKGLDERLDESARVALSKWTFEPATKNGAPIDVEAVVRIPFRLAPELDEKRR